jgi:hypothetical protein
MVRFGNTKNAAMKILLNFLFALIFFYTYAQIAPPQAFSYSAAARDGLGNALINQNVGVQFSILKGSTVGPIQYQENHFTTTNQFGLFTLTLGTGSVQQGNFSTINWGNDAYYLKVGLDATGGTNFQIMGTTQFLSVPYALYAGNQSYQILTLSNDTLHLTNGGNVYLGSYRDSIAHQTLSLNNDTLKISQGNQVVLPYNSSPSITVKINDVDIRDASINHLMVAPYIFLTATNYRYDLEYIQEIASSNGNGFLSDSTILREVQNYTQFYSTNPSCTGQLYVPASDYYAISPGRIFSVYGVVYYVPLNATATLINYQAVTIPGVGCNASVGVKLCYPALVNNPSVTGFSYGVNKVKVTFSR